MYRSFLESCTCPSFDFFDAKHTFQGAQCTYKRCRFYFCTQKEATVSILYYMVPWSVLRNAGYFVFCPEQRQAGLKTELWPFLVILCPSSHSTVPTFLLSADQYDAGKSLQEGGPGALLGDELQRGAEAVSLGPGCHPRWVSALCQHCSAQPC